MAERSRIGLLPFKLPECPHSPKRSWPLRMIQQRGGASEPHVAQEFFGIEFAGGLAKDFVALGWNLAKLAVDGHYFSFFAGNLICSRYVVSPFDASPQNSRPRAFN